MRFFISVQNEQRWCAEPGESSRVGGGRAFGSVSEIQSGWFVLGVNGWFALDATTPTNQLATLNL